jgi:hypothetical protein
MRVNKNDSVTETIFMDVHERQQPS